MAPWAEEPLPPETPPVIAGLRGDFFCSAFGANDEPYQGRRLPLHGETANNLWQGIARDETKAGCWIRLGLDLPLQGGRCEATTALLPEDSVVYQRHDLTGLNGPVNPGHHATLGFPAREGSGRLSFSRFHLARTFSEPIERAATGGASCLAPDTEISDLRAVRALDGTITDLTRYPARLGFEDIAILCADPCVALGWSAVTFPNEGYVWFALRNPRQLTSTLLWFSNGGRRYPPWSSRHVNVMGIEDMTGFFHVGLAASCSPNALSARGIATCLEPDADGRLSIPYIQGVARIPDGFDRVADIEPCDAEGCGARGIRILSESGVKVDVRCHVEFVFDGELPELKL
jgi:hypothetical protein